MVGKHSANGVGTRQVVHGVLVPVDSNRLAGGLSCANQTAGKRGKRQRLTLILAAIHHACCDLQVVQPTSSDAMPLTPDSAMNGAIGEGDAKSAAASISTSTCPKGSYCIGANR